MNSCQFLILNSLKLQANANIFLLIVYLAYSYTFWSKKSLSKQRSSQPEVFCKKFVFRNFAKFKGKHLCQSRFFNKVAGLRPATLLKKRLWHRYFPVTFAKFLKTSFFTEDLRWLLLKTEMISKICISSLQRCSVKKVFLKITPNSQENT